MATLVDWFSNFFVWMEGLSPLWAYATLFVIAYGENVMPPIPGDMVVVFAGYLAGVGTLHLAVVIGLSTVAGALGFMTMYVVGRKLGEAALDPNRYRWLPRQGFGRAKGWIERYGYGVVAANRFLSGARSVISLTAGMFRMDARRTAWWCTVSALAWTGLISYAGYEVGENWNLVVRYLRAYGRIVLIVLGGVAAFLIARWYWRRTRSSDSEGAGEASSGTGESGGAAEDN